MFAEALADRASASGHPASGHPAGRRWAVLAARVTAPLGVRVHGRAGVGVRTVRTALAAAGLSGAGMDIVETEADIDVLVVAEVAKPEDVATGCTLAVLNKADLTGFGPGGPLIAAHRRSATLAQRLGAPTEPMVGLLAVAALDPAVLDEHLVSALAVLVDEPADLRSPDGFVTCAHSLPREIRHRLIEALDLFGVAHGVVTLRRERCGGAPDVRAALRRVSRIDDVTARIDVIAADARYRRVLGVVDELGLLAATDDDVAAFLTADDTVLALMTAAVDVIEGAGLRVDPADDVVAHLRRAVHWRDLAAGPLGVLHRRCAADIARGSLRLLSSASGWAASGWAP